MKNLLTIACIALLSFASALSAQTGCPGTTIVAPPTNTVPPSPCVSTQTAQVGSVLFRRQCSGSVVFNPAAITDLTYNGALSSLSTLLGNTNWPTYAHSGLSPTFTVNSGSYVSLAFTVASAGAIQLAANTTYGNGGLITVSTVPGVFTKGAAGYVCGAFNQGDDSLIITTTNPSAGNCVVAVGSTYYLNFVDASTTGQILCFPLTASNCASTTSAMSYGLGFKS